MFDSFSINVHLFFFSPSKINRRSIDKSQPLVDELLSEHGRDAALCDVQGPSVVLLPQRGAYLLFFCCTSSSLRLNFPKRCLALIDLDACRKACSIYQSFANYKAAQLCSKSTTASQNAIRPQNRGSLVSPRPGVLRTRQCK